MREHVDTCAYVSVKLTLTYSTWASASKATLVYDTILSDWQSRELEFDCCVGVSKLELIISLNVVSLS